MSKIIELEELQKTFKVLNRRGGLVGTFKDLFSRDYKYFNAVDKISLSIEEGEIVGLLGPNGAGKSTTIKMMTGVLESTGGKITVDGMDPYKQRTKLADEIGVVFGQRSQLWWSLPAIESFKILKHIYRIDDSVYRDNIELFSTMVDLDSLSKKPIRQMSLGQRTLCDILAAFLHEPKIVFLDEPTIGLDVSMKSKIREMIRVLNSKKNTTVILTTHDMGDVDALCKRAIIINHGKAIFDDSYENMKKIFGEHRKLRVNLSEEERIGAVKQLNERFAHLNAMFIKETEDGINIEVNEEVIRSVDIIREIVSNFSIKDMMTEEISAEDVIKKIYEGGR